MELDPALLQQFALPLLDRLEQLGRRGRRPAIGLNGPVGAGKTSLCALLQRLAERRGLRLAVASIDDFYLPWPDRCRALAGNPFAVTRVPPGSHDPALLSRVLDAWRAGGLLRLPRFDKSLRQGQGDRCGEQAVAAHALLLEGWLIGCRPLGPALASARPCGPTAAELAWLPHWDDALQAYQPAWERLDELWLLRPSHWGLPRRWRFQAEARQRRSGAASLDGASLERLVRASLCSLPPELYQDPLIEPQPPLAPGPCAPLPLAAVATLDGRRRLLACERRGDHSSPSSSSPAIG